MALPAGSLVRYRRRVLATVKSLLNSVHDRTVFARRKTVLAAALAEAIDGSGTVLDVGCGDGQVAVDLMGRRPDLEVQGVDVLVRPQTHIHVTAYDGQVLPFPDRSVDYVTLVDVLHHTDDPAAVLAECLRVAHQGVIVKDHLRQGLLARQTLRAMDWVGNRGHDVRLPYNYLAPEEWQVVFAEVDALPVSWSTRLGLYPVWLAPVFERRLHFVARLVRATADDAG